MSTTEPGDSSPPAPPAEFRDDPVLSWADAIAADTSLCEERSHAYFLQLRDRYTELLKQFAKVVRISDGYQRGVKEANLTLNSAAHTDYLTGLSNRRSVLERIEVEFSRAHRHGTPFSLVLADIDDFKKVNDRFGHEAGDRVLSFVADTLRTSVRREDACSRWGGEEFLMCLPETDSTQAACVAEKIRATVESAFVRYEEQDIRITLSLGVAEYVNAPNVDEVIRAADNALIMAKRLGKNRTCSAGTEPK